MALVKAKRDELLAPLSAVSGIIERRHTLPILSNVLIDRADGVLSFLATDIEIQITARSNLAAGGEARPVTVGARKLVDILRALREGRGVGEAPLVVALAAVDPANPYGVQLPWPAAGARRAPGAWVVLVEGRAALYAGPGLRHVLAFAEGEALEEAFRALLELPRTGRRRVPVIERIDDLPAADSPHVQAFLPGSTSWSATCTRPKSRSTS